MSIHGLYISMSKYGSNFSIYFFAALLVGISVYATKSKGYPTLQMKDGNVIAIRGNFHFGNELYRYSDGM